MAPLRSLTALPLAACFLSLLTAPAPAAERPVLVGVQSAGKTVNLRWSVPVRVTDSRRAAAAFDVRAAGDRRIAVRTVLRGARPDALRLTLTSAANVTRVSYSASGNPVRGTDGAAALATVRATQSGTRRPPRPPRTPKPTPTPRPTVTATPAPPKPTPTATPAPPAPTPTPTVAPPAPTPTVAPPLPTPTATPTLPVPTPTVAPPQPTPVPTVSPAPTPTPVPEPPLQWLRSPIQAWQHEIMPFGKRSFWLQPWRAYMDTVPGTTMRDALGINFNVSATDAPRTAKLLSDSGFRRARLEFGWDAVVFDDPTQLVDTWKFDTMLRALKDNNIRPLLLLNANHNGPTPNRRLALTVTSPAQAGDRTVRLAADDAAQVAPGRTGFNALDGKAADVLITAVAPDGTATLSKPLPRSLPVGDHEGTLLRFAPFAAPLRADGTPNPAFEATLNGWLRYVNAVATRAKAVMGDDNAFDVEVWNEQSFGADFLNIASYYSPVPASLSGHGDVQGTILARTVAFLRDPANGVSKVGIGDGFSNETPWPSGATQPAGITAMDKHPYPAVREYPAQTQWNTQGLAADGTPTDYAPLPRAFFPEYYLNALQTETLIRDIAPITTDVYGTPHGRHTHPVGGAAPQVWITEVNLDLADGRLPQHELTPAAKRHILTKGLLRSLVSFVNKGVSALHFYAARGNVFGIVEESFFSSSGDGGQSVKAMGRLTEPFRASQPITAPKSLTLDSIADRHNQMQFAGDGSAKHPPLYNRDVVAVLPFQVSNTQFAIPAYVMTRDVAKVQRPGVPVSDVTRWDLPAATYRLTLGGLRRDARLTAQDPLTGDSIPVTVISRSDAQLVVEVPLTDSPRVILVDES